MQQPKQRSAFVLVICLTPEKLKTTSIIVLHWIASVLQRIQCAIGTPHKAPRAPLRNYFANAHCQNDRA